MVLYLLATAYTLHALHHGAFFTNMEGATKALQITTPQLQQYWRTETWSVVSSLPSHECPNGWLPYWFRRMPGDEKYGGLALNLPYFGSSTRRRDLL